MATSTRRNPAHSSALMQAAHPPRLPGEHARRDAGLARAGCARRRDCECRTCGHRGARWHTSRSQSSNPLNGGLTMTWTQTYTPLGNLYLSAFVGALPVIVLLGALAFFHV